MPSDPAAPAAKVSDHPPIRLLEALVRALSQNRIGTGDAAALRRLDPTRPDRRHIVPLIRLLAEAGIDDRADGDDTWQRLALIANTVALARGMHAPGTATGQALHAMALSEARLMALLSADFATLCDLLPRIARRAAAAGQPMDFRPLAWLVWHADRNEERADRDRRAIAASFLRAAAPERSAA
jgi:CRISPR type I-E-associated protein CasB/Cse2